MLIDIPVCLQQTTTGSVTICFYFMRYEFLINTNIHQDESCMFIGGSPPIVV